MTTSDASGLLRANVLQGVRMLVAGRHPLDAIAAAVEGNCAALGAKVRTCSPYAEDGAALAQEDLDLEVDSVLEELGGLDLLAIDAAGLFATSSLGGTREGLVDCLEATWSITRAVATRAFIAPGNPGRIVFLGPSSPTDGVQASGHPDAALVGLENLARTLSVEWARYGITPVTVAPGIDTSAQELAELTAYLASPAGGYFSGCLLDLRGPGQRSRG
jgi:NAD(P)-dependent dehydrogenase (short-subunit alcohol dehydrogenase family)